MKTDRFQRLNNYQCSKSTFIIFYCSSSSRHNIQDNTWFESGEQYLMYDLKNREINKTFTAKIEWSQLKTKCHCHQSVLKTSKIGFVWKLM